MVFTKIYDYLDKSFWFIPAIFISFPFIIVYLVFKLGFSDDTLALQYTFLLHIVENPDAAKIILGTIAGSVISIISISFSITMVVLSIASQQYSPRLLQNFMRKNDTKIILGIFISTFLYCLIAIGLIYKNPGFEPITTSLSFIGLLLGILSLLAFIYFINYVIQTISLSNIINGIHEDIHATLKKYYDAKSITVDNLSPKLHVENSQIIYSNETGYLQTIDEKKLINMCADLNIILKMIYQPGDYIIINTPLMELYYETTKVSDDQIKKILNFILIGNERKIGQDILYPISQMVEIAVRALSPGINDPRTAINCIEILTKPLAFLSTRNPMVSILGKNNKPCLVRQVNSYQELVKASFRSIFDNAKSNRLVLVSLCNSLAKLVQGSHSLELVDALILELNIIRDNAKLSNFDQKEINAIFEINKIPTLTNNK
jgi:uncharacterized membrane protein